MEEGKQWKGKGAEDSHQARGKRIRVTQLLRKVFLALPPPMPCFHHLKYSIRPVYRVLGLYSQTP